MNSRATKETRALRGTARRVDPIPTSTTYRQVKPEDKPPVRVDKEPIQKEEPIKEPKREERTIERVDRGVERGGRGGKDERTERGSLRGSRGSRGSRGNGIRGSRGRKLQRKGPRVGQSRDRLERVKNETINRGQRTRGRVRRVINRFGGFRRRRFGLRSIFIRGLPKFINNFKLARLLRADGRILRCNVLKNKYGVSRGIAFAEYQNPRDAWNAIKKWNGKDIEGYSIYVAYKKKPPINRRYFSYFNKNNNNSRGFNNFGGGYNRRGFNNGFNGNGNGFPPKPRGGRGLPRGGMRGERGGVNRGGRGTRGFLRGGMRGNNSN